MTLRDLPPQVEVVCDECGQPSAFGDDEFTYHYARSVADERVRELGWRAVDGRHICTGCQEAKGQEVNE